MRRPLLCLGLAASLCLLACSSIVGDDSPGENASISSSAYPSSGSAPLSSAAEGALGTTLVKVTTTAYGGHYSPQNVLACWVMDASGKRVRTLGLYAGKRIGYLPQWSASGGTSLDGVSGATRSEHGGLEFSWDGTDEQGAGLGAGSYTFRVQMTEADNSGKTTSLSATLGDSALSLSTTGAGFSLFSIDYTP